MDIQIFNHEFNKLYKWYENESIPVTLNPELDLYKGLLNFLLVGESYYFILNNNTLTCDFVSKGVEEIMGCTPAEFDLIALNERIHPDDRSWFLTFGYSISDFFSTLPLEKLMKYKVRFDVRYKKLTGEYARILYQGVMIEHDINGKLLRTLGIHSDITYLKQEGIPVLSFIGLDGEPSYLDVGAKNIYIKSKPVLTQREKQILHLLIKGKLSKEIGDILKISKQTVDTHRKNMLHKHGLSNTGELIGKAIRQGWI